MLLQTLISTQTFLFYPLPPSVYKVYSAYSNSCFSIGISCLQFWEFLRSQHILFPRTGHEDFVKLTHKLVNRSIFLFFPKWLINTQIAGRILKFWSGNLKPLLAEKKLLGFCLPLVILQDKKLCSLLSLHEILCWAKQAESTHPHKVVCDFQPFNYEQKLVGLKWQYCIFPGTPGWGNLLFN